MVRRKDGLWQEQVTVTENGRKKQRYFYGRTKTAVLRKIADYQEAQAVGPTFETVADAWWEEAEPALAETTRRGYRPAKARAVAELGPLRIRQLRPLDIARFLDKCIKENKMADKTARTQLMVVNLICRYAVRSGALDVNPARDLTVPKGLEKHRRDIASPEDIAKVKSSLDLPFGDFAYWALYTGCRRGELLALTWEDVDLENRTITISKSLYRAETGKMELKRPKTEAGVRMIPLLDRLAEKITPGTGPVFPRPDGGYLTDRQAMKRWEKYQELSGVTCTPHQLRHTFATMLFEAGVSESDAQDILGHAQISTTKDVYTHIREQRKAAVRQQLLSVDIA